MRSSGVTRAYRDIEFEMLVLDEAQHIRIVRLRMPAVKSVRARNRVVLTGTPLEIRCSIQVDLRLSHAGLSWFGAGFRERARIAISRTRTEVQAS